MTTATSNPISLPVFGLIDKLPAWARHFAIIVAAAVLTVLEPAILSGHWDSSLIRSAEHAAVAAIVAQLTLIITPLTRQYGVGS